MTFTPGSRSAGFEHSVSPQDSGMTILIVEARFYEDIADELGAGAIEEIEARGAGWERIAVPGCLEIPQVVAAAARQGLFGRADKGAKYAGAVALGCVIRGETTHYEIVSEQSNIWLMDAAIRQGVAIGNGILTVENTEQAFARARGGRAGKGGDAARACLRLVDVSNFFYGTV